jgi:hypothetical protein
MFATGFWVARHGQPGGLFAASAETAQVALRSMCAEVAHSTCTAQGVGGSPKGGTHTGLAPPSLPTCPAAEVADAPNFCACGIANGNKCCDASCGTCGGSGCASRPGGGSRCCVGGIRRSGVYCANNAQVACMQPPDGLSTASGLASSAGLDEGGIAEVALGPIAVLLAVAFVVYHRRRITGKFK